MTSNSDNLLRLFNTRDGDDMLERADLKKRYEKEEYDQLKDELTAKLVKLQQDCIREKFPVIITVDGWSASGKGTSISKLVKDLDPRSFMVHSINAPTEDELRYPLMKRYWERVGQYGTFTIFGKSWYHEALQIITNAFADARDSQAAHPVLRKHGDYVITGNEELSSLYAESAHMFERQLIDDGYLLVKCFFHISKKEQLRRLEALHAEKSTAWRVTKADFQQNRNYDLFVGAVDQLLELTNTADAPWNIIAAENRRVRRIEFLKVLVKEIESGLERHCKRKGNPLSIPADFPLPRSRHRLVEMPKVEDARHDLTIDLDEYRTKLKAEQDRLAELQGELYRRSIPMMLVYEGWDAAGKGGNIKRVASALDARDYRVVPSAAPTKVEKEHPFLWRYWVNLPKTGHIAIYDRSWYGRVMVERVEGFCTDDDWRRAFEEINDFEWEMYRTGTILLKFWIDVSQDEQLARFEARKNDPDKAWKLTDEDWRNRDKYPQYCQAINDMLCMTSTDFAPWHIVESDDKRYARIKALEIINAAIKKRLEIE